MGDEAASIPFYKIAESPGERSGWYFTWPTPEGPHAVKGPFCSYLRAINEQIFLRDREYDSFDDAETDL